MLREYNYFEGVHTVFCCAKVRTFYRKFFLYDLKFGDGDGPNLCRVKK